MVRGSLQERKENLVISVQSQLFNAFLTASRPRAFKASRAAD